MGADGPSDDLRTLTLEDQLRFLWAYTRGILFEFDAQGRYLNVWTNEPGLLARPADELLGRTIPEVLGEAGAQPFMERIERILQTRHPESFEYELEVQNGHAWFQADAIVAPRTSPPPTIAFLVRDITQDKLMRSQLEQAERLASLGMVAAAIGHEINNPLAYVMNGLAWARGSLAELQRDVVQSVAALGPKKAPPTLVSGHERLSTLQGLMADALLGTEQIRRVVRQLSFFARKDADDAAPVPLEQALDAAIQMAMTEIRHRARLVRDYAPTPRVVGEQAMSQVFLNVLVNAAQAIPLGGAEQNEIRVTTRTTPRGWASVEVSDSGEGIDPRNLARIFDPFFTTKPQGRGTGLGLSICRDLVKSRGGEISVENRAEGGATVRIELPPAPQSASAAEPSPTEVPAGPPLAPTRILVVDDERRLLSVLALTLGERHEVVVTDDVYGALTTALGEKRFDYILCDLMMPALTGMDFYAAVKAADAALAERIIFMTGGAFTPRAREFLERVKNPRIEKPFIASDVEELIRRSYPAGVPNVP